MVGGLDARSNIDVRFRKSDAKVHGDIDGQPTTPTSMVSRCAGERGALPVLGIKNPTIRPLGVDANHAPPWVIDVVSFAP